MDLIHSIISDPNIMFASGLTILTGVFLFVLRYASRKTGVPTEDLQKPIQEIHDQAKAGVVASVIKVYRDARAGKYVSTKPKVLPSNDDDFPESKEAIPKEEEEQSEEKEPAIKGKTTPGLYMVLFLFLIPIYSCSLMDAGVT